ncbi:MAG: hypothetical protein J6K14_07695 [Clostridia bacterium]|nr:hypothetical protein [Clostridia bacterium]
MNQSRHLRLSQEKFHAVDLTAHCADYSLEKEDLLWNILAKKRRLVNGFFEKFIFSSFGRKNPLKKTPFALAFFFCFDYNDDIVFEKGPRSNAKAHQECKR